MQEPNNPHLPPFNSALKLELMATAYAIGHKNINQGIKDSISQAFAERLISVNKKINAEIKDFKYKLKQLK